MTDLAAEGDRPMSDEDLIARASAGEGGAWTWDALVDELSARLAAALRERDEARDLADGTQALLNAVLDELNEWEASFNTARDFADAMVAERDALRVRAETAEAALADTLALLDDFWDQCDDLTFKYAEGRPERYQAVSKAWQDSAHAAAVEARHG